MTDLENTSPVAAENHPADTNEIGELDSRLTHDFEGKFVVQRALSRHLVSFQGNKNKPISCWYKYKEAFSADLETI